MNYNVSKNIVLDLKVNGKTMEHAAYPREQYYIYKNDIQALCSARGWAHYVKIREGGESIYVTADTSPKAAYDEIKEVLDAAMKRWASKAKDRQREEKAKSTGTLIGLGILGVGVVLGMIGEAIDKFKK